MRVEVGGGVKEWRKMPTTGTSKYGLSRHRTQTVGTVCLCVCVSFFGCVLGLESCRDEVF